MQMEDPLGSRGDFSQASPGLANWKSHEEVESKIIDSAHNSDERTTEEMDLAARRLEKQMAAAKEGARKQRMFVSVVSNGSRKINRIC
jgi:hypothetical protein